MTSLLALLPGERSEIADPDEMLHWHSADRASFAISDTAALQHHAEAWAAIIQQWALYPSALPAAQPKAPSHL